MALLHAYLPVATICRALENVMGSGRKGGERMETRGAERSRKRGVGRGGPDSWRNGDKRFLVLISSQELQLFLNDSAEGRTPDERPEKANNYYTSLRSVPEYNVSLHISICT